MHINIQNKYDLFVETGGLAQSVVYDMAQDIGNKIVHGMARADIPLTELVEFYLNLEDYVIENNYNTYIAQQIITQMADHLDSEFDNAFDEAELDFILESKGISSFIHNPIEGQMTIH